VLTQQFREALAMLVQQSRRSLDVREEKRHCSAGKVAHVPMI